MTDQNTDYDNPWKSIIELYFRDFIQFFFPWIEPEIDWSREVKFLDKELRAIRLVGNLGTQSVNSH
jgi:hypothetical protein